MKRTPSKQYVPSELEQAQFKLRRLIDEAHTSAHNITLTSVGWEIISMDLAEAAQHAARVSEILKPLCVTK